MPLSVCPNSGFECFKNPLKSSNSLKLALTYIIQNCKKYAENLSDNEPHTIIEHLMNAKTILPTYEEVYKQTNEQKGQGFLSEMFNNSLLDSNGNTIQYFSDNEEKKNFEILRNYNLFLEIFNINLIAQIFFSSVKKKKLNAEIILNFLNQYSWFGKELQMSTNGKRTQPYCWLALIAPSLNEYFVSLDMYLTNSANHPNFILCIDSLALKIEGMIRDICKFTGVATFKLKNKKEKTVSQEKDIHELLYEEELVKSIDKDDLFFFKFLLVEKAGYNLRHKVAHSLMTYHEYNISYINLLIIAILKLGKYDFVPKNTSQDSESNG